MSEELHIPHAKERPGDAQLLEDLAIDHLMELSRQDQPPTARTRTRPADHAELMAGLEESREPDDPPAPSAMADDAPDPPAIERPRQPWPANKSLAMAVQLALVAIGLATSVMAYFLLMR